VLTNTHGPDLELWLLRALPPSLFVSYCSTRLSEARPQVIHQWSAYMRSRPSFSFAKCHRTSVHLFHLLFYFLLHKFAIDSLAISVYKRRVYTLNHHSSTALPLYWSTRSDHTLSSPVDPVRRLNRLTGTSIVTLRSRGKLSTFGDLNSSDVFSHKR
jgi:hypothetical protein